MSLGLLFWIVYLIVVLVGAWGVYAPDNRKPISIHFAYMLLVGIVGWSEFGFIVSK